MLREGLSQVEVEQIMFQGGVDRAERMMVRAEEGGRASDAPYAKEIIDLYVSPIAEIVKGDITAKIAGRGQAHVVLLKGQDPEVVAALAVRVAINTIMQDAAASHRKVAYHIGKAIHSELILATFADLLPELYYTLTRDFSRRLSKDERHRVTVFRMQAQKAGIPIPFWDVGARDQVGMYLLGLLEDAGMVTIDPVVYSKGKQAPQACRLALELCQRIEKVKGYLAITSPVYGPCVEPPLDWTTPTNGGFHTRELKRTHPCVVRHRMARQPWFSEAQMPTVLAAVNALQRTAWSVNTRMLDVVRTLAETTTTAEIVSLRDMPAPDKPDWLEEAPEDRGQWTQDMQDAFKKWKQDMNRWHTARRIAGIKYGRFYNVTRAADMFVNYPRIYFVYFADSRGRLYPMTYGLNPQGSDIQKAMLQFADALPVNTPEARKWFLIQGANKWGFDKAKLVDRMNWHADKIDLLLSFADDPINNRGWLDADSPLQFLAWCFEFAEFHRHPDTFLSRQPISMDGSCNGLQNLSAVLRDEVGGQATNITKNEVMEDIYRRVAEAATVRMTNHTYEDPDLEALRQKWLAHGISRSVVKRSVMTTPYGVTRRSAIDYVISDYLAEGKAPAFEKSEYMRAASVLMDHAWPAIGDVVVKGIQCMDWLKTSARLIMQTVRKDDEPVITWISPSGFPAVQAYYEVEVHRINSRLHGPVKLRVLSETDTPDSSKHVTGFAPNFVHSLDAAHLHMTAALASERGITSLAMIHDDYGTHAYHAEELFHLIRDRFVYMYETHDPINDLKARYPYLTSPPERGSLNIRDVLESDYFFS